VIKDRKVQILLKVEIKNAIVKFRLKPKSVFLCREIPLSGSVESEKNVCLDGKK